MKLSKLFSNLPKRLAAGAIIALAAMFPVAVNAADMVTIEGNLGVANQTAGDTKYGASVNASYNDIVKFQVYYHNKENPDSGKIAQNLNVKINIPTAAGQSQTQTATIKADNSNTVTSQTTVHLDRADAYLQYLPGSAVWRHNTGTNENVQVVDTHISDDVVMNGAGLRLEDEKPCYNFSATVTVLARVMVPGVSINKQVRVKGGSTWNKSVATTAGNKVQYLISYKNTGNTTENNVVIADKLPNGMTYVPGSTILVNGSNAQGKTVADGVVGNGIQIGSYVTGTNAFVSFEATVPAADKLACGENTLRNVATAQPYGMQYYYNTADVTVNKTCTPPPSNSPSYACTLLTLVKGDNRTVTASVQSTQKNATLKTVTYNFGDNNKPGSVISTDKKSQTYQYASDGNYTVTATLTFRVGTNDVTGVTSQACAAPVSFTTPGTPTTPETPTELPNTGTGNVIGIIAGVSLVSAFVYRLFLSRRLAREQ